MDFMLELLRDNVMSVKEIPNELSIRTAPTINPATNSLYVFVFPTNSLDYVHGQGCTTHQ